MRTREGDLCYGICSTLFDRMDEPHIKIAAAYLSCIAHELTRYFQWVNDLTLTDIGRERQATNFETHIMYEYFEIKEHP